ncbi:MAG: hypothetical protein A3D31_06600 [Candidatus Fluviicola riflensis]|nr:MAG: hypothetical protein CHH17_08410 [Candidatus Fluviicola riflensis]OGS79629.1 MAG: hypothetical protein A3D31_06600 [Candidatus Fluviicola riflensis]OGS87060.1 MAG: hypothetical protein A2724_06060 [Fluviicola sp. RIFCSPHIGHO2_01_FULL_43_53]OGS89852.1 MAG: hypothetical protein A3E30_02810 [Fluviicola sp. RIFCSPHIGHO2_12_FULL_43_24]
MKFKDFEGSPEEIHNFFQNNGLDINQYLNINGNKPASKHWIYILIVVFIILNIIIAKISSKNDFYLPISILTLGSLGALVGIIQHNVGKVAVSVIIGVVGLIIMLVSFRILSPKEVITTVKDKSEKYFEKK